MGEVNTISLAAGIHRILDQEHFQITRHEEMPESLV